MGEGVRVKVKYVILFFQKYGGVTRLYFFYISGGGN